MLPTRYFHIAFLAALWFSSCVSAQELRPIEEPHLADEQFGKLLAALAPKRQELPWLHIDWELDLSEARLRASREDKPMLIISAADGNPAGRC